MQFTGQIDNFDGLVARKHGADLYEMQAFTTSGEYPRVCLAGRMGVSFNLALLDAMKPILDGAKAGGRLRITVEVVE